MIDIIDSETGIQKKGPKEDIIPLSIKLTQINTTQPGQSNGHFYWLSAVPAKRHHNVNTVLVYLFHKQYCTRTSPAVVRWSYVGLCENANSVFVTHKKARAHLWNCKIPERKKRNFQHLGRICNKKKISWQSDKKDKKISFIQLCPWQPSVWLSAVRELLTEILSRTTLSHEMLQISLQVRKFAKSISCVKKDVRFSLY